MAKRQTKRTVTIVFKGREPEDPKKFLSAVEEVFRPREVEVSVDASEEELASGPDLVADEPLETEVREHVRRLLDERDRIIRHEERREPGDERYREFLEMEEALGELKVEDLSSRAKRVEAERSRLTRVLWRYGKAGWCFGAKIVWELAKIAIGG